MSEAIEFKSPEQWALERGEEIIDPDGWRFPFTAKRRRTMGKRYQPRDFAERITLQEYIDRASKSTCKFIKLEDQ